MIKYAFVDDFNTLGVAGGGAWDRVDMRLEKDTGHVYVLEVNSLPVVLYPKVNSRGDDLVIEHAFPGAQPALFDMMLATKLIQLG